MEALYLIPTCITAALLILEQRRHDEDKRAWRLERVGLLNRIQAPEVEIAKQIEPAELLEPVPFDPGAWGQTPEVEA